MEWLGHTAAWFPSRVEIAGRRLMPPTIGHWRLLECVGSPFACGGRATPADTALALAILSRPWRRARRMLRSKWRVALATLRGASAADGAALSAWLDEVWWTPERFEKDGETNRGSFAPCAPVAMRLAAASIRDGWLWLCPEKPESVWDMPIPLMLFSKIAFEENDGAEYETPGEAGDLQEGPGVILGEPGALGEPFGVAPPENDHAPEDEKEQDRDGDDSGCHGVVGQPDGEAPMLP